MNWNAVEFYIRENAFMITLITAAVMSICLLLLLLQVSLTRREVHKICKKIRRYFDVVFTEQEEKEEIQQMPKAERKDRYLHEAKKELEQEQLKKQKDAELLMEVISEVF